MTIPSINYGQILGVLRFTKSVETKIEYVTKYMDQNCIIT